MHSIDPRIGVVVPTRNKHLNVISLLASLEKSTIHPAACIIVDASDYDYDVPFCSFHLEVLKPGIRGQVMQRNYGISVLGNIDTIEYVITLDDDIVIESDTIANAIVGIAEFTSLDSQFVGFSLNITNMKNSNGFLRRLIFHPKTPGVVTSAAFGSSLCNVSESVECGWVLGGAAIWNLCFINKNINDYPLSGKAYAEDFYFCSKIREQARFAVLANAKCLHIDQYENKAKGVDCRFYFREGFNDTKARIFIAKKFRQYSVVLAVLHTSWVGFLGVLSGALMFNSKSIAFGFGRIAGIIYINKSFEG